MQVVHKHSVVQEFSVTEVQNQKFLFDYLENKLKEDVENIINLNNLQLHFRYCICS